MTNQPTMKLACGCAIPEVAITLLGTGKGSTKKRMIECSEHGPQEKVTIAAINKAKAKAKRQRDRERAAGQLDFDDIPPF